MEKVRALVGVEGWDCCLLWKVDQHQRCLQLKDCICRNEEQGEEVVVEEDSIISEIFSSRDGVSLPRITYSSHFLSQLPSSIPFLDPCIHTQILLMNQPRWLNFSMNLDPCTLQERACTRLFIPITDGLVELFVAKQVEENQQVTEFIISCFSNTVEEVMQVNNSSWGNGRQAADENRAELNYNPTAELKQQYKCGDDDDDILSGNVVYSFPQQGGELGERRHLSTTTTTTDYVEEDMEYLRGEEQGNHKTGYQSDPTPSDCDNQLVDDEDDLIRYGGSGRPIKGHHAKNLKAERRRRKKLNERLYALRSLVPKISKLDRASILVDAIDYIKELQKQVEELHDELEDHSDIERMHMRNNNDVESELFSQSAITSQQEKIYTSHCRSQYLNTNYVKQQNNNSLENDTKMQQMEVQIEVFQVDVNEFLITIFSEHKARGFSKLMEAVNSLGLEVTNANMTSFRSCLESNVFKVKKMDDGDMINADEIRDTLLDSLRNSTFDFPEMIKVHGDNIMAD